MMPFKLRGSVFAAAILVAAGLPAGAQSADVPAGTPNGNILSPAQAPQIVIRVVGRRVILTVPSTSGSGTVIGQAQIERSNPQNLTSLIAAKTPGVAQASTGEIHVRGSHGQYTYYLDGAPLPTNVGGSFSDLINPKDIQTLRVFDGGFPAEYGGQLAAIFDVTTRGGYGRPNGFLQQLASSYETYQSTAEVGGSEGRTSYFLSGVRHSSDIFLSPLTETPMHDSGLESVGFGKLVYQPTAADRITFDAEDSGSLVEAPNTWDREFVGQDDIQKENTSFANLIWKHGMSSDPMTVALYSHDSHLRFNGGSKDLAAGPANSASADPAMLDETFEDQSGDYVGLRIDKPQQAGPRHRLRYGIDIDHVTGHQTFIDLGADLVNDRRTFMGGDRSAYIQDDWTPGRFLINYGARYDVHQADITTSQISPRLNVTYHVGRRDDAYVYYDRLFQPINIEDVKKLSEGATTPFQPERDDFFETGWTHRQGGATLTADAYYRAEKNAVDDSTFANTQIDIPENFAKGYARGLEFAVDGPLSRTVSYYANYARSWAKEAGPVSGGLLAAAPTDYFYDDHDQTHTATLGVSYEGRGAYADFDAEYGSGFPFGEVDDDNGVPVALNFERTEPHTTIDLTVGGHHGRTDLALIVDNVLNHPFIVKQASAFSNTQWQLGRSIGAKLTINF